MTNPPPLQPGKVHIWFSIPDDCRPPELEALYLSWLDPEETRRHSRFKFPQHRREFLVAHALLRSCLSHYVDVAPAAWQFEKTAYGRPEISQPVGLPPLRFNLSHTQGLVACAVTLSSDIGIDVEQVKPDANWDAIASSSLTPNERTAIQALDADARPRQFCQLWTLKEAYAKAVGLGLSLPFNQFSYQIAANPGQIGFTPPSDHQQGWQFASLSPTDSHYMAVAVRYPSPLQIRFGRGIPGLRYDPIDLPMVTSW